MSRDISPIGIRLPDDVKDELYKRARVAKRAFNSEVLITVEAGLAAARGIADVPTCDLVRELIRRGEYERIVIEFRNGIDTLGK